MFDPRKHEPGPRQVLGRIFEDEGFVSVEKLLDLLVAHPATGRHVAGKLAVFLLGDAPPPERVSKAAAVFTETRGDLGRTVSSLLAGSAVATCCAPSFKDPLRYVTSALRLLSGNMTFKKVDPVVGWLSALGQPLFGRTTPDGYSLYGRDWVGAGQLTQRFDIAREMVHIVPRLLEKPVSAETVWSLEATRKLVASFGAASKQAISRAESSEERLALLLSSPEFMYRRAGETL